MQLNKDLNTIYEKLITNLNNAIINTNSNTIKELSITIDTLINHFNQELNENIKIVHEDKSKIEKLNESAFMFAQGDEIHYSTELIINTQKEDIKNNNYSKEIQYNNITFALLIINSIYHEMIHCVQFKDLSKVKITYQNYLNQLSIILANYPLIEYIDRTYEGEAYGKGVKRTINFIKDDDNVISNLYKQEIKNQFEKNTTFKKNMEFHTLMYNINSIPFFEKNNQFHSIILFTNKFLSTIDKNSRNSAYNFSPLGVIIGLNEDGSIKDPFTLMNTYFNQTLKYGYNNFKLNKKSLDELINIYTYLLIPQLNPRIYTNLCNIYGNQEMDVFIKKMEYNIIENIEQFRKAKSYSLSSLEQLEDFNIKDRINRTYINKKTYTCINYLRESLRIINNCYKKEEKVLKRKTL